MCTRVPLSDIGEIRAEIDSGANPKDAKMKLAYEITRMYHGESGAKEGEGYFVETFQNKQVPEDVVSISPDYTEALLRLEIIASKTELRRLLEAGGVRNALTEEKLSEIPQTVTEPLVLKIGKRRFVKLLP
jgi:tyrosyl-tRNA synthetase